MREGGSSVRHLLSAWIHETWSQELCHSSLFQRQQNHETDPVTGWFHSAQTENQSSVSLFGFTRHQIIYVPTLPRHLVLSLILEFPNFSCWLGISNFYGITSARQPAGQFSCLLIDRYPQLIQQVPNEITAFHSSQSVVRWKELFGLEFLSTDVRILSCFLFFF